MTAYGWLWAGRISSYLAAEEFITFMAMRPAPTDGGTRRLHVIRDEVLTFDICNLVMRLRPHALEKYGVSELHRPPCFQNVGMYSSWG